MTTPAPEPPTVDAVVVGGGLSGLTCALRLQQASRSVVLLEARDRVGGRTLNAPIGDGQIVEVGGQWAGPAHQHVVALAAEVGIRTFPTHIEGRHLYAIGDRVSAYRGHVPRRTPIGLVDYRLAQARLERLAATIDLAAPQDHPRADAWDRQTAQTWIDRRMRTRSGRELMRLAVNAVLAAEPREMSLLHWLYYLKVGRGLNALIRTRGGYQQDRFVGGSQEIAERVAALLGDAVVRASPVRRIEQRPDGVLVTGDRRTVRAGRVVVAVPPAVTGAIEFEPDLPGGRYQLGHRMHHGAVTKVNLVYSRPFWRDAGLSGHALLPGGPVKMTFDNSPPGDGRGVLLAFLLADDARRLQAVPAAERQARVIEQLTRLFGPDAGRPDQYHEHSWTDERWSHGCYCGFFPPGGWTTFGAILRQPAGAIHWAAAETATDGFGSMDGAVLAGERAAREVLSPTPSSARR
ncbi:flavin monoamine oxidase family protein [Patulibacter defluvii]|uniref:flavin monoamine oxidase family protein n=1 Tax=Patulibacter defluvii TaxID=3095358 RepID=UPI002A75D4EF|nr:FAD-dependent oxidoreductase [Patulibacter sp. DM4]